MSDAEIQAIAPTQADRETLAQLLAVLNDTCLGNAAKASLLKNVAKLAELAVPLLKFLL